MTPSELAALVLSTMTFMQDNLDVQFPDYPPIVTIESTQTIKQFTKIKDHNSACSGRHLMISEDVDLNTPKGEAVLVHELVDFSQGCQPLDHITAKKYFENEKQAEQIAARYLNISY